MREVTLPSGATLKIQLSPFAVSKSLYQALLTELRMVPITSQTDTAALFKDLFSTGFSSPLVEKWVEKCFERCLYNDLKIDGSTFEPVERRQDYMKVCVEVAKENVSPFLKNLFAEYSQFTSMIASTQKPNATTTI